MRLLRPLTAYAVQQLATVDYTVANRVTEDVARVVTWAYAHNLPAVASACVHTLQAFDGIGAEQTAGSLAQKRYSHGWSKEAMRVQR